MSAAGLNKLAAAPNFISLLPNTTKASPCTDVTSTITEIFEILRDSHGSPTTTNVYPITRSLSVNNTVTLHIQVGCKNGVQINSIVYDKSYPTSSLILQPTPTAGPLQSAYSTTSTQPNKSLGKQLAKIFEIDTIMCYH